MSVIFNVRKLWVAVLGSAVVTGSLLLAASSQKAQELQPRSERDEWESSFKEGQRRMLEQRPLVSAASMIRSAIDQGSYEGYSSIVIEDKGVALWWKGDLPEGMVAVVEEATKIVPVRVAQAAYSLAELRAAAELIRDHVYPGSAIQAVKFDPTGAGLILSVPDTSTAKAIFEVDPQLATSFITQSLPALGVPTRVIFEEPPTLLSRDNDSPPWSGGAEIVNTSIGAGCTSGFGVNSPLGPAILTAGHCGNLGNRFTDGVGQFIGNVGAVNKTTDVLIIPTTGVISRIYVGGGTSTTTKTVTRSDNVFIGEFLCQSGNTSANVTGNPVCNLKVINFGTVPQNLVEAVQVDNQTAARPGDSGGPVYSDQGSTVIAKGTSTYVAGCCRLGFQDFVTAQQDLGVSIPPTGGVTVFSDGAESAASPMQRTNVNEGTQWTRNTTSPFAGSFRWRAGGPTGGSYGNNGDARLTTPPLDLSGASTATLTFAYKQSTEQGFDFFQVRVSTDGGSTFTRLLSVSGQNPEWSNYSQRTINLNSFAGRTNVRIQFRLRTDVSITGFGVAVDEIKVVKQ